MADPRDDSDALLHDEPRTQQDSSTRHYCSPIESDNASDDAPVDNGIEELRLEAYAVLRQKIGTREANHDFTIEEANLGSYGSSRHVLSNLIIHLPRYEAQTIAEVCMKAFDAGLPEDTLLTDDQITVYQRLNERRMGLLHSGDISSHALASFTEYKNIMSHALKHADDGPFIAAMYVDRGMYTLKEILDFLPTLKDSSHCALREGIL